MKMSATFKNAKKKKMQTELRKIMIEHKEKLQKEGAKVNSPLAKYNDLGQLTCILCKSVVRSEGVWPIHINAKQHKHNVEAAKKLKERTMNFTAAPKRPITPPMEVPNKKIKGILKNSNFKDEESKLASNNDVNMSVPSLIQLEVTMEDNIKDEKLPEGFFDDPKLDAKARNQEYKNPADEEWERFQKEIRDAEGHSAAIIAEDQEEATSERQIEEIDEQINKLSKVLHLVEKKSKLIVSSPTNNESDKDISSDEISEDFDEFLDWRAKKSFIFR